MKKNQKSHNSVNTSSNNIVWNKEDHIEGFKQQDQIFSTREKRQQEQGLIITTRKYRERFRKTS